MLIFLDVDGVLNKKTDWIKPFTLNITCVNALKKCLRQLEQPKIILISSWRKGFVPSNKSKNADYINMLEAYIKPFCIRGKIPDYVTDRQKGINDFLKEHPDKYVIIDDDQSEYKLHQDNLYICDYNHGFTDKDIKGVLKRCN